MFLSNGLRNDQLYHYTTICTCLCFLIPVVDLLNTGCKNSQCTENCMKGELSFNNRVKCGKCKYKDCSQFVINV